MSQRLNPEATEKNHLIFKTPSYEIEITLSDTPYSPEKPVIKPLEISTFEKGIIQAEFVDDHTIVLFLPDQKGLILHPGGGIRSEGYMVCYPSLYSLTCIYLYEVEGKYFVTTQIRYTNPEAQKNIPPLHC